MNSESREQEDAVSRYGWEDCSHAVRAQVFGLLDDLRHLLGDNLLGVYLHGSLAMGCFNLERSDLDLLVIARRRMGAAAKRQAAAALLARDRSPSPIELSILRVAGIRPWRHPAPYEFHYSGSLRDAYRQELSTSKGWRWHRPERVDPDLAAHITVVRERGICLCGPPIREVLPDIPAQDYLQSILEDFDWGRQRIDENPVYFILNACRIWAYVVEGNILSKAEGAVWAMQHLPEEQRRIVQEAAALYAGHSGDERLDEAAVRSFADDVDQRLRMRVGRAWPS